MGWAHFPKVFKFLQRSFPSLGLQLVPHSLSCSHPHPPAPCQPEQGLEVWHRSPERLSKQDISFLQCGNTTVRVQGVGRSFQNCPRGGRIREPQHPSPLGWLSLQDLKSSVPLIFLLTRSYSFPLKKQLDFKSGTKLLGCLVTRQIDSWGCPQPASIPG